jgi:hypothetical protein
MPLLCDRLQFSFTVYVSVENILFSILPLDLINLYPFRNARDKVSQP